MSATSSGDTSRKGAPSGGIADDHAVCFLPVTQPWSVRVSTGFSLGYEPDLTPGCDAVLKRSSPPSSTNYPPLSPGFSRLTVLIRLREKNY